MRVPERPTLDGLEAKWSAAWERDSVYRFDRSAPREDVFAIDTPPPTVSGSLHVGHVFSYTHTDAVARYQRMRGREVFYPMGWDDNGLPTERRVQNHYGVRCDPSVGYDPAFQPPAQPSEKEPVSVSRPNFVELCLALTATDEQAFEALWRTLGLSVDWSMTYTTIGRLAQRISQRSFLGLLARGEAYQLEAPTLWDVDFQTAVAQAELEDRERPGAMHKVRFAGADGGSGEVLIETTRPELIPACVALLAHPDDERHRSIVGGEALTPLFGTRVPVLTHPSVERDKGTGLVMVCTFGDLTDVTWWRELGLPVRSVLGSDGRLLEVPWGAPGWESQDEQRARADYAELQGRTINQARRRIVELLEASGDLIGEPQPVTRAVKFFEKGERPVEIVTSRQWFLRTIEHREQLLARGRELQWHPPYMRPRFEDWVNGLNGDWCVSRQRFFGVPFPIWYPIDDSGTILHERPIAASEEQLPVDPSTGSCSFRWRRSAVRGGSCRCGRSGTFEWGKELRRKGRLAHSRRFRPLTQSSKRSAHVRRVPVQLSPARDQLLAVSDRAQEPLPAGDDLDGPLALLEELDRARDRLRLADQVAGVLEQLDDPFARLVDRAPGSSR